MSLSRRHLSLAARSFVATTTDSRIVRVIVKVKACNRRLQGGPIAQSETFSFALELLKAHKFVAQPIALASRTLITAIRWGIMDVAPP
jgi:hypothetical protein